MHWICTVKLHGNRLIWRSRIHFAKGRNNDTRGEIKAILKVHNETLSESILLSQRQGVAESAGVDGAMPFGRWQRGVDQGRHPGHSDVLDVML